MNDAPIYCYSEPADYAAERKQRALDTGCSEEYAEALQQDVLRRAVKVETTNQARRKGDS